MDDAKKTVFLVGPRASGKTTVGRLLARALGRRFADTDVRLENDLGMSIARFVAEKGWPAFREAESRALRDVCDGEGGKGLVVSTGGGMVLSAENRDYMRSRGVVVYLSAPVAVLADRLEKNGVDEFGSGTEPAAGGAIAEEVGRVMAEREPLYRACADFVVDAAAEPEAVCAAVKSLLEISRPPR